MLIAFHMRSEQLSQSDRVDLESELSTSARKVVLSSIDPLYCDIRSIFDFSSLASHNSIVSITAFTL
jgi:hypothetical protein